MELRQLKTLVAISDFGTFAAAADAIGLTQSAVSLQIKGLEEEIGVEIFDRRHRPPLLNDRGRTLVEQARKVLAICDDISRQSGDMPLEGVLAFGAVPTSVASILPPALAMMRARHPKLQIRVSSGLSAELAAATRSGELDAAIVADPARLADGLVSYRISREPLLVIAPPDVPGETDKELLEAGSFIQFSRRAWTGQLIDRYIADRGIQVRCGMEIDSLEAITRMVNFGLGVSVVPLPRTASSMLDSLKWLPFGDPPLHRSLVMIERQASPQSQLVEAFTEVLRQVSTSQQ
ncbi:MAG TPA: LysR family transcriptional regulator [Rhizobiales bacterium]|nr:LysR family transcriptional regulator [Hyphomicrobiales bacterium]